MGAAHGVAVVGGVVGGVQRSGDGGEGGQQLGAPVHQRNLAPCPLQAQARLPATGGGAVLVVRQFGDFLWCVRRAVGQQAVQQEHVDKTHGLCGDTHRHKRVEVEQAHLDVFHTPFTQRM